MSFCQKLHPSERGLEIMEKYHTSTSMPTAFFLWELFCLSTQSGTIREFSPCWLFQHSTFYFSSERFSVFFVHNWPEVLHFLVCQWHRGHWFLSGLPLTCSLLRFCSQEERRRRGWWHERAGSLGRSHVTTAAPGWKKDFGYLFRVQMCFVEKKA